MKRVGKIIFWMVVFFVLTLETGAIGLILLGYAGWSSWGLSDSTLLRIGISWSLILWGMPVIGLILGLLGKLPGTKRVGSKSHL
jgi:hypothetical protein